MDAGGFRARLRACRQSAGLSQQELAGRSGLSVRAISDLERGRTRWPYPDSLHRLADALDLRDADRAEFIASAGRRLAPAVPSATPHPAAAPPPRQPPPIPVSTSTRTSTRSSTRSSRRTGNDHNIPRYLPAAVPAFVGREDQLAVLSQVLNQPGGTAVVTAIGGTAGVGKTALAVQWAHQVAPQFPDGQLFVNLRGFDPSGPPVTSAEAVRGFLDALAIPAHRLPQTVEGQLGLYRSLLAGKRMLVVLDNARDVAQVRPLLPGSPTCRVVVTSRNQLTSLAAIEAARPLTLGVLTDAEARQFLRQRLGSDRVDSDPGAVAQIIAACAHLPLALSVIAARAAMRLDLSLAQVAEDLAARPDLDAFAGGDDPAADVRAAFSWSYRQLDADAARAFRLAGLPPAPVLDRYALAALTGATAQQAGHLLDVLAGACMIQPAGPGRSTTHDLLRGYARELAASQHSEPERRAALERLFDYYLGTAAAAMDAAFPAEAQRRPRVPPPATPAPEFPGEAEALAWLNAQRANLVAVITHTARQGWPGHATQLAATLFRYFATSARSAEAVAIHTQARHAARLTGDRAAEASALLNIGAAQLRLGRWEQGAEQLGQALALCQEIGDRADEARAHANLGVADLLQGRPGRAVGHFQRSLALHRELGDRIGEARALGNLGFLGLRQGHYAEATGYLEQSLALSRDLGDRGGEARVLANLGEIETRQGRYGQAAGHFDQALALTRQLGDPSSESDTTASLGLLRLREGNHQQATGELRQALALSRTCGDLSVQAAALNGLGEVLLATGRPAAARAQHATAAELAAQAGERYEQARAHEGLARSLEASADPSGARAHWKQALTRYADLGAPEADGIRTHLGAPRDVET
jgi:tetratricopeptide (TPR) repeat protein/transcriptional regulator with XRE-family HTH domain